MLAMPGRAGLPEDWRGPLALIDASLHAGAIRKAARDIARCACADAGLLSKYTAMPSASQARRGEEKLSLILRRVSSVRMRLNRLALQQGLFESLSIIVGTGAILFLAAFLLHPLAFLTIAIVLGTAMVVGLVQVIRRAYRMRATLQRAAIVADQRTGLKGRLTTIVSLATTAANRGQLWPYLLEDTLSLREEFTPAKVEPRRISRSLYPLLAYCLLALLVAGFALIDRRVQIASKAAQADLEFDVNNLDVRPLDPDLGTAVEVTGDRAAMGKLDEKLARAGNTAAESDSALGRMMARARDLAGDIQDRMTGHDSGSRIRLRLTYSAGNGDDPAAGTPRTPASGSDPHSDQAGDRSASRDSPRPPSGRSSGQSGDATNPNQPSQDGERVARNSSDDPQAQGEGDEQGAGGSSHGSGSDPQHLFGQAEEPPLGSEGFALTIEARPAERGPRSAQSWLPPRVRASLNPRQLPDEPIARSAVPDDDRAQVKRVFDQ